MNRSNSSTKFDLCKTVYMRLKEMQLRSFGLANMFSTRCVIHGVEDMSCSTGAHLLASFHAMVYHEWRDELEMALRAFIIFSIFLISFFKLSGAGC